MAPVVLVTGADGFVGRHIVAALNQAGWHVRLAQRSPAPQCSNIDVVTGFDLGPSTDWQPALNGVQAVVHLAARAHRSIRIQQREEELYFSINVDGTMQLARNAADAGVRNFIFLSSVAVNGSVSDGRPPFSERDKIAPTTVYGRSKAAAEAELAKLASRRSMAVTAVRAPMIYGGGAGGNFHRLTFAVHKGIPLPFSMIHNRRAFLGVENLSSFIAYRLSTEISSDFDVLLLADDQQVSTPRFIRELAHASARIPRLFPIPTPMLRIPLRYLGLSDALLGSLEIDTAKARATGWKCPLTLSEGLARAVAPSQR
jgi:UDP-glucose 4-epimerase|nr:NAD-dependent epimerase/dehydratase family protein [Nitrobacter sp. 62-13]